MQGFNDWDGFVRAIQDVLAQQRNSGVMLLVASPQGLIHFTNIPDAGDRTALLHKAHIVMEEEFRASIREQASSRAKAQIEMLTINAPGGRSN